MGGAVVKHSTGSRVATREVHFFPGQQRLLWVVDDKVEIRADAWGGEEPKAGVKYDVMKPRPTTPGRFVIHSYAPYKTHTWPLSRIAWGTPLMVDLSGGQLLYKTGHARPAWGRVEVKIPGATIEAIKDLYLRTFGTKSPYDKNLDGLPETWVFNDFGPWAVRYFKDSNHNHKLDGKESLSGEMFHTTPDNEAQAAAGAPVTLVPSHGCIHLNPNQREQLRKAGAFATGTDVVVHRYDERVPDKWK